MTEVTWRIKHAVVSWTWKLPLPPATGNEWLAELFIALRKTLGDFGHFSRSTLEFMRGEAQICELTREWDAFLGAVRSSSTLQVIYIDIDLNCRSSSGEELVISEGATIGLSLNRLTEGVNEPERPRLILFLNTDIYDPDSPAGDNEATAAQNAPRLEAFLGRVEALPAEFSSLDESYAPGAHRYGFTIDATSE